MTHTDQSCADFEKWYSEYHNDACDNYGGIDCTNPKGVAEDAWQAALNYAIASNLAKTAPADAGLRDCVAPTTEQSSGVELPEPQWHKPSPMDAAHFPYYTPEQVRTLLAGVKDSLTVAPAVPQGWIGLTDEDRDRAFNSLPDMLDGFLKKWGWLHFAKAIEQICREKNSAQPPKEQT